MNRKGKFFQIGFNRCGTTAISAFFRLNGFACIDWDHGRLARQIKKNHDEGRFILSGYDDFDVFTDMEYLSSTEHIQAYKYFDTFLEQVEGARFILNKRNKNDWLASRRNHGGYVERYQACYGLKDEAAVLQEWAREWDQHHAAVQSTIPRERLLIFDIQEDSPIRLCAFSGLDSTAARHFTHRNYRLTGIGEVLSKLTPRIVKHAIPDPIKQTIKRPFRKNR